MAVIDGAFVIVAGPLAFPWPVTDLAFTESESPQEKGKKRMKDKVQIPISVLFT